MEKTSHLKFLISAILFIVGLAASPAITHAATLYFSPSSGSYAVGNIVTLGVYVSSSDQTMNAASGVVSFPSDKLEIVSVSKTGSIFTLWVQEPSFSNSAGTISFEGIVLNPGFTGSAGKIITLTLKTKSAGSASLLFSSGSILANDGQGTNILESMSKAQFTVEAESTQPKPQQPPTSSTRTIGTPSAPKIVSATHPDPQKWYSSRSALFTWNVSEDITAARLLYGTIENIAPNIYYDTPISKKTIEDVPDGTYWFHVRLRNNAGWGEATHFKFNVDTTKPILSVREIGYADDTKTRMQFNISSLDQLSGISHYEIVIDDKDAIRLSNEDSGEYTTTALNKGEHTISVTVFDNAGNSDVKSINFSTEGYSLKWLSILSGWGLGKSIGISIIIVLAIAFIASRAIRRLIIAIILFPSRLLVRKVCNICRIGKRRR